ncbi:MAG TPA: hypothetical protein VF732_08900, partial [Nitrospira sp.]
RTSFRALCITRIEIKESVIYDRRRQIFVESEGRIHPEIELNGRRVNSITVAALVQDEFITYPLAF